MRRRVPPLNALRTFEAVARNGSFTRAAEELFVTEPAVSRAVKVLEDHFQTQLFERQPRGLALTAEAKVLLPTVQASLDAIADVSRELYRASERPSLRLLVTPHVCAHWLMPRLGGFLRAHPDLDLHITSSVEMEDVMVSPFDAAIWWGSGDWERYECRPLFRRVRVPACAPSLAGAASPVEFARHFDAMTLLHEFDYQDWNEWLEASPIARKKAVRGIVFSSYDSVIEAAVNGLGVALPLLPMLTPHVEDGRLVLPLGTDHGLPVTYYLVYPKDGDMSETAAAFVDFAAQIAEI